LALSARAVTLTPLAVLRARTSWLRRRPSPGTLLAAVALFVALGGPAEAAKLIDGGRIRKGSVTGAAIRANTLTGRLLKAATITGDRLADRSVALAKLSPDVIATLTATPSNEVTGGKVLDRSLSGADLGDETLGQSQIARSGVGNSELADGGVDGSKIADGRQRVGDVAAFAGTADLDPPWLVSHSCWHADQPATLLWERNGASIADDAVFVAPPAGLADVLVLSGRPVGGGTVRLVVCNVGSGNFDPAPFTARYLTIGY
jgi:hypothetical protein